MFRILLLVLLFNTLISAKNVPFTETKYYASLDKTIIKKGLISFQNKKIAIRYNNETHSIEYDGTYLRTYSGNHVKKVNLDQKPAIKMFFMLFESVYFNKTNTLSSYFDIKKKKHTVILSPKKNVAQYISSMQYKKEKGKLHFLDIHLANGDRIHIEETE